MYVQRNSVARSSNHILHAKAISITHPDCVCSPNYLARNAHATCHLWLVRFYSILPHYLTNDKIFGRKLLNIKHVF